MKSRVPTTASGLFRPGGRGESHLVAVVPVLVEAAKH